MSNNDTGFCALPSSNIVLTTEEDLDFVVWLKNQELLIQEELGIAGTWNQLYKRRKT